jgi:queuosine precursor transporter
MMAETTLNNETNRKKTNLYIFLSGIVLTNAILAEIIGVKIFSVEATLGISPLQIPMFDGNKYDLNLTAGVVSWPIVFIISDLINEYFGKKGVQKISFLTAGFIAYSFLMIYLVTLLPPAQFWLEVNSKTATGNNFNINDAFKNIFRQGLNIIIGSITAFVLGQLLDAHIFQLIKKITGSKWLWLRATGSTLVSQFIDSVVVIFIAFYVFGNWSFAQTASVAANAYIYKFIVAVLTTPFLYLIHGIIDRYLGKKNAEKLSEQSSDANRLPVDNQVRSDV